MTLPKHHPDEALLLDYASGAIPEAFSLAVATHLALCPQCRRRAENLEAIGGASLAEIAMPAMSEDLLTRVMARLDETPTPTSANEASQRKSDFGVPRPLRDTLSRPLEELPFKRLAGVEIFLLGAPDPFRAYVLRVAGGSALPRHGHSGDEMTLVLRGGFSDGDLKFGVGDVAIVGEADNHAPRADPEGCVCLVVSSGALRMNGPISGLVARWFGV